MLHYENTFILNFQKSLSVLVMQKNYEIGIETKITTKGSIQLSYYKKQQANLNFGNYLS